MGKPLREVFGMALASLGDTNQDVIVLDADLANATKSVHFWNRHPDRFINVGIAEANMVSIAAGLSTCGKIPFACTFSFLLSLRAADQIRSQISYPNLNVKLVGTNAGLSGYGDGVSHQSVMDLAVFRTMPNFTVIVPSDATMVEWAIPEAARHNGPVFIRIPRVECTDIHPGPDKFRIGRGILHKEGRDVSLVAMGLMVSRALEAATLLDSAGISAEVVEIHTLKPVDESLLSESLGKTGAAVVIEEHSKYGALCSAVAEVAARKAPVPMEFIAVDDRFASSGEYLELLEMAGLTVENIAMKTEEVISRKP